MDFFKKSLRMRDGGQVGGHWGWMPRDSSWPILVRANYAVCACVLSRFSHVQFCVSSSIYDTLQEYCSGLPCPPPENPLNPEIKPSSLKSPALAGGFFTTSTTWEAQLYASTCQLISQSRHSSPLPGGGSQGRYSPSSFPGSMPGLSFSLALLVSL